LALVYWATYPSTERSGHEEYKLLLGTVTGSDDSLKRRPKYGAMRERSACVECCLSVCLYLCMLRLLY